MTANAAISLPGNVIRFEVALYASLLLDTISTALQAMTSETGDTSTYGAVNIINVLFILGFVFLVGLAANRRKNWARMVLLAALILSAITLSSTLASDGVSLTSVIDVISIALTAFGLHASFTGDARGWFTG